MTSTGEFREFGKRMVDYVADYFENLRERRVIPNGGPGHLLSKIPREAPEKGEAWQDVMADVERVIMPSVAHWNHPNFHAYFTAGNSFPSLCADMLADAIGCVNFSWASSPASTELEMAMINWMARMLGLPEEFMFREGGRGGGVIESSASEATLVALLSAREKAIAEARPRPAEEVAPLLIAYGSRVSHSSIERACIMGGVKIRLLEPDHKGSIRGPTLARAIAEDRARGLIPFCLLSTLGTTACCSYDDITELGPVCNENNVWLHIDAAYAGTALVCPEFREFLHAESLHMADSFLFNPHKLLLVHVDCCAMYVKNRTYNVDAFHTENMFLSAENQGDLPDLRHWQISFGGRFRSLKLWFVMRMYGREGIRKHIRYLVSLAHEFESLLVADGGFEIAAPVTLALVAFRIRDSTDEMNARLNRAVNDEGVVHVVSSWMVDRVIVRFVVCSKYTTSEDITLAYRVIRRHARAIVQEEEETKKKMAAAPKADCIR